MIPMFLIAVVAIGAVALVDPVQVTSKSLLRVLVETEDTGGDLTGRRTSVTDLSAALATKKKVFIIVETEELADVIVEVLDRTIDTPKVVIGIGARPGQPPGSATGPARTVKVRATVKYAGQTTILANKNAPLETGRGWKSATDDLAKQIEQWVGDRSKR